MDLRENYKKEKGKWSSVVCSDAEGNTYFTDDYVEWLEDKLVKNCSIPDVVGRSEQYHCELFDFGRCEKPCDKQCDSCYWMETKKQ